MARYGQKTNKKPPAEIRLKMRKHMESLGFKLTNEYFSWCIDNGFEASVEKNNDRCIAEKRLYNHQQEQRRILARIHRNPKKLIEKACAGKISAEEITRPIWREFCQSILVSKNDDASRHSLCNLLFKVQEKANFLTDRVTFGDHSYMYIDALIKLNDRRQQWIRPLDAWHLTSHNRRRQFASLARHLLARFSVPAFMDSVWFRNDKESYQMRDWFIHIGSGNNIRTAKLPIPLTKRMAHHLLEAPGDYSIENALYWGQIHALGGDRRLTEAILGTRIGDSFENNIFWTSVIRFFVANPLLDRSHVGPIIDFLQHQKFESQEVVAAPGVVEQRSPPQPNLSMRGRTPENLLKQIERWHKEMGRVLPANELNFKRSGIGEFQQAIGRDKKQFWRIRELLSGSELITEGKTMRHCVATYAPSCATGNCSIWSMELHTPQRVLKHQTVEVNRHDVIVESRGRYNRLPSVREYEILKKWAQKESLTISRYVRLKA